MKPWPHCVYKYNQSTSKACAQSLLDLIVSHLTQLLSSPLLLRAAAKSRPISCHDHVAQAHEIWQEIESTKGRLEGQDASPMSLVAIEATTFAENLCAVKSHASLDLLKHPCS